MPRKKSATGTAWRDPDDAPELTEEMLDRADFYVGETLVKRGRGRPRAEAPKQQITLRLDADVIRALRDSGPGWSSRVNDVLARSVRSGTFARRGRKRA